MKHAPFLNLNPTRPGYICSQRGIALVIVLAVIVLITALVVGFLERAGSDRTSAASYSATATTHRLADTAVNLVQGQINQATTRGSNYCWASQPGAIRVFNSTGNLDSIYRLYSASSLQPAGTTPSDLANDIPPAAWANSPALWVDLNAPATVTGTNLLAYPIIDPRDPANPTKNISMDGGFNLSSPPGATTTQPAPMPVQWLYTLQNGQIIAADPTSTGSNVTFTKASIQPSKANPIVGRIAFWTDDETCKVNINTAGGDGTNNLLSNTADNTAIKTFWDVPRYMTSGTTLDEATFGLYQPASHEYQRYPGHPATTSLKSILYGLGFTDLTAATLYGPQATGTGSGITPRYSNGGSLGATTTGSSQTSTRQDRLYPTVSEMLFHPDRSPLQNLDGSKVPAQRVNTANFFLTANSRAPEVNLFGQPRISMWPVSTGTDANHRTATDQLLAFCSTVGTHPYYFSRQDPKSETTDITIDRNSRLLNYLDRLSSRTIPGFGGSFDTKYPTAGTINERQQILTEMFDYIRTINLHDSTVTSPYAATSGSLSGTQGEGQVVPSYQATWNTQGFGRYYKINEVSLLFVAMGTGTTTTSGTTIAAQPVNINNSGPWDSRIQQTTGIPPNNTTAIRAFLVFSVFDPGMGFSWIMPNFYVTTSGLETLSIADNTETASTTGTTTSIGLGFPSSADITPMSAYATYPQGISFQDIDEGGSALGGFENFRFLCAKRYLSRTSINSAREGYRFPFYSGIIPVKSGEPFVFNGGTIIIYLCAPTTTPYTQGLPAPSNIIQTYNVSFPKASFPVPTLFNPCDPSIASDLTNPSKITPFDLSREASVVPVCPPLVGCTNATLSSGDRWQHCTMLAQYTSGNRGTNFLAKGDVMKGVVLNKGDVRLLARKTVPISAFAAPPDYSNANVSVVTGNTHAASRMLNAQRGKLASGANYLSGNLPVVPALDPFNNGVTTFNGAPGDWDNGISNAPDGPYINRADEGAKPNASVPYPYQATYFNPGKLNYQIGASLFSPNRQVPSPVMFGSLPTGVAHELGWQTLLFRPGPGAAGLATPHPGEAGQCGDGTTLAGAPPDHLWLDLFWMPVAEPYAISEPLSTAGKVNLNYQIVPFTYITRSSAVRAVLASEKIAAVNTNMAAKYKAVAGYSDGAWVSSANAGLTGNARLPINLDETIKQFDEKFTGKGTIANASIYRSASEICDIFLVPQGYTRDNFPAKWYASGANAPFGLVGDNVRERPYADIYSRVTTKSNTYKVHYTVQALKNASNDQAKWDESRGVIIGEYRGSTTLERYIDPNDAKLITNDFADSANSALTVDSFYKWRIVHNEQFCP